MIRTLPSANFTLDRLDLDGHMLHKTGGGELDLGFGFVMNGGTLRVDLTDSATVTISNLALLNGGLQLDIPYAMQIELGQTFRPIRYVNGAREFQDLLLPELANGLDWDVRYESNSLVLSVIATRAGDFNGDGVFDCTDVNALVLRIADRSHHEDFDLTGDGLVDAADLQEWLVIGGEHNPSITGGNPFLPGDANLDGFVDAGDFNIWNANKFTHSAAWCNADFNADGAIDAGDFNVWNANKFTASNEFETVPEPSALALLLSAALIGRRRRPNRGRKCVRL